MTQDAKPGAVRAADADFRVIRAPRDDLVELQVDAEGREFSTRWSSVDALLAAVASSEVHLMTLLRERRHDQLRAYRCLVLHQPAGGTEGAVATLDVAPERLLALPALNLDLDARVTISRVFALFPAVPKA